FRRTPPAVRMDDRTHHVGERLRIRASNQTRREFRISVYGGGDGAVPAGFAILVDGQSEGGLSGPCRRESGEMEDGSSKALKTARFASLRASNIGEPRCLPPPPRQLPSPFAAPRRLTSSRARKSATKLSPRSTRSTTFRRTFPGPTW